MWFGGRKGSSLCFARKCGLPQIYLYFRCRKKRKNVMVGNFKFEHYSLTGIAGDFEVCERQNEGESHQ